MENAREFTCANCGETLEERIKVCPKCGCKKRIVKIFLKDEFKGEIHDYAKGKVKRKGKKKPVKEFKVGDSFHRKTGKWNYRVMDIDRENDHYREVIIDKETGEVIHYCEEPLSKHRGHGSAKKRELD